MAALKTQINTFLEAQRPASCRNVFYRLVQAGLVDKTEAGYQNLIKVLTKMRRQGCLPYGWLTDASRRGYYVPTWRSPDSFLEDQSRYYRWDMWAPVPHRVEVWCESAAMYGVLAPVCRDLAVSLFPTRGYSSIGFAYDAAEQAKRARPSKLVVVYVGDFDYDGKKIDQALLRELRRHVEFPVVERRIAVNHEQVVEFDLETRPDRKGGDSVQAEAVEPAIMRRLLWSAILEYLPEGQLERAEKETAAGRETLFRMQNRGRP